MNAVVLAFKRFECKKGFEHGRLVARFQNTEDGILGFGLRLKASCFSTLQISGKEESVSTNVLVRSIVYIVQKTDRWEALLKELCLASASKITPPVAVQVLKRIKKPEVAFKFFKWLDDRKDFRHDSLSYSAIIKVLSKNRNPANAAIADSLLHKKIELGLHVIRPDYDYLLRQWAVARRSEVALSLLNKMIANGFKPSIVSCRILLEELFRSKQKDSGWELFNRILDRKVGVLCFETVNVGMKNMCMEGKLEEALELFAKMKAENHKPNSESFDVLMRGCCEKGEVKILCEIFKDMLDDNVKPTSYTMSLLIKELCKKGKPEYGNRLFNHMRRVGWIDRKFVYAQLVESLCNYGWWLKALKIFVKMVRRGHHPKPYLYGNLVRRLCLGGRVRQAYQLKDLLLNKGFLPGVDIYNGLINGLSLSSRMDLVERLLVEIHENGVEFDLNTHNIVLRGYCLAKNPKAAQKWVKGMGEEGLKPNAELSHMLAACIDGWRVDEVEGKT